MTFLEAVRTCSRKYGDFTGRASRSEYWYFILFTFLVGTAALILYALIDTPAISWAWNAITLLPTVTAGARRLHDTHRTGWWQLLVFLPLIGAIVLIAFLCEESRTGPKTPAWPTATAPPQRPD